jgi:transposase
MTVRTFPLRVAPLPGEAIDSWLEAIARRMAVPLLDVTRALDLPRARRPRWLVRPTQCQLTTISTVTGIDARAVSAMTLSHYDGTGLDIDQDTGRIAKSFPFGYRPWSRYCPQCLAETDGRWRLHWRLGWSFACVRHYRLLADECPQCGDHPRPTIQPHSFPPAASVCVCGLDLTDTPTLRLRRRHPIINAQQRVFDVIADDQAAFGVYSTDDRACRARSALNDVKVLANRTLNFASLHGLAAVKSANLPTSCDSLPVIERPRRRATLHSRAPARAIDTAVGVTAALDILCAPTVDAAADRAHWLVDGQNKETGPAELHSCSLEGIIPAGIIIKASAKGMGAIGQLRYRTALPTPSPPHPDRRRAEQAAASVPALFWPAWSVRFVVPGMKIMNLRLALSGATVLAGTTVRSAELSNLLGGIVSAQALNCYLFALSHSTAWPAISTATVRLTDHLAEQPAPINYTRRRQLDYTALLSDDCWEQMCRATGDSPGIRRKAVAARCYLVEKISGTPARKTVFNNPIGDSHNLWKQGRNFARMMTMQLAQHLDDEARTFLKHNRIDEPLTWHPPVELIADLDLPGSDPAGINRTELHQIAAENSYTVGQLAAHFHVDQLTIRHLFEQEPIDFTTLSTQCKAGKQATTLRLRGELDVRTLRDLYVTQGLTLRQIAERYGVTTAPVHLLAARYQIPMRRRPKRPQVEWLTEQWMIKRRTQRDIAADIGVSRATIGAWLSQVDFDASVLRQPTGPDMDPAVALELLKPALTDKHGARWLQILTQAMDHPSIAVAERGLGLGIGTLRRRLPKLEAALGAPVIARNRSGLAMIPTPLGVEVARAVCSLSGSITMPGTSPHGAAARLTVRVAPVPGEALDSWLEAVAHRCRAPFEELLAAVGLPRGRKGPRWMVALNTQEQRSLAKATGVTQKLLRAMTLQAYEGPAVRIDFHRRTPARAGAWGYCGASRYCPACLTETGGRWKLEWRLSWSFTCLRHHALLADTCPTCGNHPRRTTPKPDAVPDPGRCACPPEGAPHGGKYRCSADLTDVQVLVLPNNHPVFQAQRHVNLLVAGGQAARAGQGSRPLLTLDDIARYGRRAVADPLEMRDLIPADLLAAVIAEHAAGRSTDCGSRRSRMFSPSAVDVAAGVLAVLAGFKCGR